MVEVAFARFGCDRDGVTVEGPPELRRIPLEPLWGLGFFYAQNQDWLLTFGENERIIYLSTASGGR